MMVLSMPVLTVVPTSIHKLQIRVLSVNTIWSIQSAYSFLCHLNVCVFTVSVRDYVICRIYMYILHMVSLMRFIVFQNGDMISDSHIYI